MLFPENPEKRPELWGSMSEQLVHEPMCFLISDCAGHPNAEAKILSDSERNEVLKRMRERPICRISANRGVAVAPHFSATLDQNTASLTELMTFASDGTNSVTEEQLKRDLEMVVINLLYANSELQTIFVPLIAPVWSMKDAYIQAHANGLIFKKIG